MRTLQQFQALVFHPSIFWTCGEAELYDIRRTDSSIKGRRILQMDGYCKDTRRLHKNSIPSSAELGLSVGHGSNFSQISDDALDNLVRQILTSASQSRIGLIPGALQYIGVEDTDASDYCSFAKIPSDPVMSALRQTRRIICRTYNVLSPHSGDCC